MSTTPQNIMDFKVVAIEKIPNFENSFISNTAILINNKYIISSNCNSKTCTIFTKLFSYFIDLNCIYLETLHSKNVNNSLHVLHNLNIKSSNKIEEICVHIVDRPEDNDDDGNAAITSFNNILKEWQAAIKNLIIYQSQELIIKAVPFGDKHFLNTMTKGIVSNLIGENSCLILSDCPTTPGCEGGAVYIPQCEYPIGIVLASSCFWKGDYTGLTVILNFQSFFSELLGHDNDGDKEKILASLKPNSEYSLHNNLLERIECSVVQVYSGCNWGTGIVLDSKAGYIITNSHVIIENENVNLFWQGCEMKAKVLFKSNHSSNDCVIDLALLYCSTLNKKILNFDVAKEKFEIGQEVFAIGYALLPKEKNCKPSISKGVLIQYEKTMIKTSCCINPGMSGGPILNGDGKLIGIIVCNTRMEEDGRTNPRFNMAIPYSAIRNVLNNFFQNQDISILQKLCINNSKSTGGPWKYIKKKSKL